ncbi:MAG: trigger factor [Anaerorhabdus sp.]
MSNWEIKEKSKGELTVVIEGKKWQEACGKAYDKLAKNVEISGFRKGQAPKHLVEKQVSKNNVYVDAVESLANELLVDGVKEHNLDLVARPQLKINSLTDDKAEIAFEITVSPEVELGEYKGLDYKEEAVSVSDEEVETELKNLQNKFMDMVSKEGAAELGDTVTIDFLGKKDGVEFAGGAANNHQLELGSNSFIPGFEDQLVGVSSGDKKDVEVTFPEEYHAKELAGAPVVFEVTVHDVTTKQLPELDDEFAKDVNAPNVETLQDLKKHITENLEATKKTQSENIAVDNLISTAVDNAKVDIPEEMIKEETNQMIAEFSQRIQQQGANLETFLQMTGQKMEDLETQMGTDAQRKVKIRLVLAEIAKKENFEVSEDEIKKEYESIAEQYQMEVEKLKELIHPENLKQDIKLKKAFELIKESSKK